MDNTDIFINGLGCVSPQHSTDNATFLSEVVNSDQDHLSIIKPDYKSLLKGVNLRRMSHLIRMGVYAGKKAMAGHDDVSLDAIITGTGLGASEDTEIFLDDVYNTNEGIISPTRFIQSTHNTVGAQIALLMQCYGYNFTYVHRGASFESALLDAMMMVDEGRANHLLVGGVEEITPTYLSITGRMKSWKTNVFNQLDLLDQQSSGSIAGEGSAFFYLGTDRTEQSYAKLKDIRILFKPKNEENIHQAIQSLLVDNDLKVKDLDLVLLGLNGDVNQDAGYRRLGSTIFGDINQAYFKHLCGEYKTATAFGMWTGCQILDKNVVPDVMKLNWKGEHEIKNILLYNNYNNTNYSLILLQHVKA